MDTIKPTVSLSDPVTFPAQYEVACLEFLRANWDRRSWQMREEFGFHNLPHLIDDDLRRTFLAETLAEIARAAAGEISRSDEARAGEVYECTQSLAESLFAPPGLGAAYHIPPEFWETPIGAMIARSHIWLRGDDLITIAEAARLRGVTPQAIGQAIDDGRLTGYIDSSAPNPRKARRLVSRRQVEEMR